MVDTTYVQARAVEWYAKFKDTRLDIRRNLANSGVRSMIDVMFGSADFDVRGALH